MPRNNCIDFAQAVLRKYPEAKAISYDDGAQWAIHVPVRSGIRALSATFDDRDRAWGDAYERIVKQKPEGV